MALIPEVCDPTLAAIDRELERRKALEPRRSYLGASAIGDECERKLWYSIRPEVPRKPFNAASIKRFDDGHRGEAIMAERLRMVPGVELWTEDDQTGGQIGGTLFEGRFGWHVDGVIRGLLQSPETPHVWEHKQVGQKKFDEFGKLKSSLGEKLTLQAWDPVYYAQAVVYMELLDLTRHFLTVCTPGGRDHNACRTEANPTMARALLAKAQRILSAGSPPARLSERPEYFKCKMCDFHEACHQRY
ncbi:hypothetical protein [Tautonia marina]|uniref:hypothetical protein n=1 Tax=Tautonia marina TaxID=2653855 RepID=UPI001260C0F2|nr:hypothetical protein [Tautonia marina]